MTDFELGWVTGLIEGEGNFGVHKRNGTFQAIIQVKMKDEDTIRQLLQITGIGTVTGPYNDPRPNHSPMFTWRVQSKYDTLKLVYKMLPYLSDRRQREADKVVACVELLDDIAYMTDGRKGRGYLATMDIRARRNV